MRRLTTSLASLILVSGCSSPPPTTTPPTGDSMYVTGFAPAALEAGYTRYITPKLPTITAGADIEYCSYVTLPSDADQDVLDVTGAQSKSGHHAVLYASSITTYAVGENHVCDESDMLSISFLGAIGGEGTAGNAAKLPDGLNFRLPKGRVLLMNTHWVNATTTDEQGQAVIDVRFSAPDSSHTVADLFANNGDSFSLPAGQTTSFDVSCPVGSDLNLAMVTNHMHGHGVSAFTEIIHADGTKEDVVRDDTWTSDQQFNPHYQRFSVATPKPLKKGDTYHTRCTWTNDGDTALNFPTEMCAGVGFYFPGNGMITCNDGYWPGP